MDTNTLIVIHPFDKGLHITHVQDSLKILLTNFIKSFNEKTRLEVIKLKDEWFETKKDEELEIKAEFKFSFLNFLFNGNLIIDHKIGCIIIEGHVPFLGGDLGSRINNLIHFTFLKEIDKLNLTEN